MYYIWDKKTNRAIMSFVGGFENFETYEDATRQINEYVLSRVGYHERDLVIKPLCQDFWCIYYRQNLIDGSVDKPVWFDEPWYQERMEDIKTYAFIDPKKPEFIQYYESTDKAIKGRTTSIKPGKFLQKYFADILSGDTITAMVNRHREQWINPPTLKWARTPDEMEAVYSMKATFWSCMQHSINDDGVTWPKDGCHPARAYGAGDLACAYISAGDRLLGRALVWEEKDKVGRVYGDGALLRKALSDYGIHTKSNGEKYDTFEGAHLLYIPYNGSQEIPGPLEARKIVSPYLDGDVEGLEPTEDGRLRIVDQEWDGVQDYVKKPATFSAEFDDGVLMERCKCPHCSNMEAGFYFVEQEEGNRGIICHECIEFRGNAPVIRSDFDMLYYDTRYHATVLINSTNEYGEYTQLGILGVDDFFTCDKTGEHWEDKPCYKVLMANGETWSEVAFVDYGFTSDIDGLNYPVTKRIFLHGKEMTTDQYEAKIGAKSAA